MNADNWAEYLKGKAAIRAVVALLIFLRRDSGVKDAYDHADRFMNQFERDWKDDE